MQKARNPLLICAKSAALSIRLEQFVMSDLQRQVAEMITGGGCVTDYWDEALETAEKVISLVRSDMDDFWISADECVPPNDDLVLVRCKRAILGEFDRVVTWFALITEIPTAANNIGLMVPVIVINQSER
jgi:hypothetical protein